MNKETIFTILKNVLAIVGALLLGKNAFGILIDAGVWLEWTGAIMGIIAVVWSFKDKTNTWESFEASFRYVFTFIGTYFITRGILSEQMYLTIFAAIVPIVAIIYREVTKQKNLAIAKGKIAIMDLQGVRGGLKKGAHVTPVVHSKKTA